MIFQAEKKDIKAAAGDSFLKSVFNFDYNEHVAGLNFWKCCCEIFVTDLSLDDLMLSVEGRKFLFSQIPKPITSHSHRKYLFLKLFVLI